MDCEKVQLTIPALKYSTIICCGEDVSSKQNVLSCLKYLSQRGKVCCAKIEIDVNLTNVVICDQKHCCINSICDSECLLCSLLSNHTKMYYNFHFLNLIHEEEKWHLFGGKYLSETIYVNGKCLVFCVERSQILLWHEQKKPSILGRIDYISVFFKCRGRPFPSLYSLCFYPSRKQSGDKYLPKPIVDHFDLLKAQSEHFETKQN